MTTDSNEDDFWTRVEVDFIGRESDLQTISEAWTTHRVVGLYGVRSVGKSRFIKKFLSRYKTDEETLLQADLKQLTNLSALYSNLCAQLGVKAVYNVDESDRWIRHVVKELAQRIDEHFVIVFDNVEDYIELKGSSTRDLFLTLCRKIMKGCCNVKVVITSTTDAKFTEKTYFSYKLEPLKHRESRRLLRYVVITLLMFYFIILHYVFVNLIIITILQFLKFFR